MSREILQPPGWARPRGYANGVAAAGRLVFVAGQIGWDAEQRFVSDDFASQVRQALANVVAVLACAGAQPEHLVRMTWYVTSRDEYNAALAEIGAAYRELIGRNFPAMSVVVVAGLLEPRAKVEIEATAVV
ncbi:MAG TPA: RidA family protein [Steroidobacteraceae bacterium]|jgi:enamine deaminase RidA (YjgF/YER057c/UK114 family)|nr:RidA family protein [Steroidobacteraceae bacterium]